MSEPLSLPVLPLRNVVLFPGVTVPITIGRSGTLRAIEAAQASNNPLIFAVTQRQNVEDVTSGGLYTIGTVARIEQIQRQMNSLQLIVYGEYRGIAMRVTSDSGHLEATVRQAEQMLPLDARDPAFIALHRETRERANELVQSSGLPREAVQQMLASFDDPANLADLVASYLVLDTEEHQSLLETLSVEDRLRRVLIHVQRQLTVLNAQRDLKSQVQEELGDRQREIYLREQLKAIQRELDEDNDSEELEGLRTKLENLALPDEARKEVDRELRRLGRINQEAIEAQVIRTFLETVAELPWSERNEEQLDLKKAEAILEEDHFGLADVKDRVLEFLAVRQMHERTATKRRQAAEAAAQEPAAETATQESAAQTPKAPAAAEEETVARSPIMLFIGPPGVGKTSLAKSIARAMGRKYARIALGGARDEADIRGHRRTYVGAMPGRIIQGLKQAGSRNPVFLLDEVDKLGASFQGDPASALLEVLDPAQNDSFTDNYLGIPFDLSEVLFICTANFMQGIPGPLKDRMELVEFSGYTEGEKLAIAQQYLVPRQRRQNGLAEDQISLEDDALGRVITEYTREAGVRQLEREIGRVGRKVARKIAAGELSHMAVDAETIKELLGRPKVHPERMAARDQTGVATGMYYTPAGGDIMFVEASTMPGKGNLVLTGQLGDVMKESAQAAWSYARSHAEALHIDTTSFERDVHVHVPAGAIPKDGPSAGVAMATALVSQLSGRPARHDLAMTGEITLNGRVLPIGGVKEKILGGVRAGIRSFLLPAENEPDLEDLPEEVRAQIDVVAVHQLGEVLALALRDASFREGRLLFGDQKPEDVVPLSSNVEH